MTAVRDDAAIRTVTHDEGFELVEVAAQRELKMGAKEFYELWSAGKIENPDRPEVMRVVMLLPFLFD